ncbi:MAG TPA: DUF1553 domain-containing protein, partial [Verrucomicrobiae bacterium]|nr:DUF1553 domain-containing protein [Verrucomicrobiae bacterium]
MTYGAARRDPFWNRLKTAPGNEEDSGSLAATTRAGRMVRTPTFTLKSGLVHYLIRGKTRVYAAVDSHIMIAGPLHGRLLQTFDTGDAGQPRWVTHDLSPYIGHRAHIEFGPEGEGGLEILMVVDSATTPAGLPAGPSYVPETPPRSWPEAVEMLRHDLAEACRRLAQTQDNLKDEHASHRSVILADWLIRHQDLLSGDGGGSEGGKALREATREFLEKQEALAREVRWESKTAVAWFDGTGVDESVLLRGKPFRPGEVAERGLPAAFSQAQPIRERATSGRLALGRELIDPENPLVARVMVNRVWHHLFGRGLVATVDNFGYLGARPTHPELLDHLAWRFAREQAWSLKRLIRELILSRAFAMSSRATDAVAEAKDPDNLWLHRMPVRRLEAEAIRDALLAVSGRLNPAVGGPPVPVHLTEFVVGRGRPEQSGPLDGDGRRSIYTAVRRNFLPT